MKLTQGNCELHRLPSQVGCAANSHACVMLKCKGSVRSRKKNPQVRSLRTVGKMETYASVVFHLLAH